jgi:ubiquinone/menaquinone biosynthesis C-methylase UbiE/uncharacterized protein YbaR (Trm112 family)
MYVCPDCKTPLVEQLYCKKCRYQYTSAGNIPILLSNDPRFRAANDIKATYDSIYDSQTNVWENQGRTPEFLRYFSQLLAQFAASQFLEIGCGEGFLLAAVRNGEKFAVDLSVHALKAAQARTQAQFSVALAERLPFPTEYFDLVTSVGVMEHFLNDQEAMREIHRVLKPGGHYVSLLHVDVTLWERLCLKIHQYVLPKPRPVEFVRWLRSKLRSAPRSETEQQFVRQPIQNKYTTRSARTCLEKNGFRVIDVIHRRKYPALPLAGLYVVILIARK